ncbi:MAG: hypothetical protein WAZ34_14205 [Rhodocyclaceae bacterium]
MKRLLIAAAFAVAAVPAFAADVSISIGQPGFYGRIDIGDYPQPQVIYRRPMMIERVEIDRPPIYLRVPPGHAKNWRKHCHRYNACGERVYFVQNNWYNQEYVPRYQERHRDRRDGRDHRDGRRDEHRDHDRGNERYGDDRGHDRNR